MRFLRLRLRLALTPPVLATDEELNRLVLFLLFEDDLTLSMLLPVALLVLPGLSLSVESKLELLLAFESFLSRIDVV